MRRDNHRLAASKVMPWREVTRASALLKELLDHAQGNPETMGNLGTCALVVIVGCQDSLTEIQRERSHAQHPTTLFSNGYTIS